FVTGGMRGVVAAPVELIGFFALAQILALEQSAIADQPHRAAHGVRAAAETKKEKLVAGLVVEHQEVIGLLDVLRKAHAESATAQVVESARAHAGVVEQE